MTILENIRQPRDLKALTEAELGELAEEIREFLVHAVARTGGHLGPNLGVVELSIALHRVFESPVDRILWDTGHQSYVHKLLTGRQDFSKLRGKGGLSGYPSREESEHDVIENSHASTALGWADGLAKAHQVQGEKGHVVAVIGDGALTGGMAWEALNNIAAAKDRPLIIVVNDNERSYAPTIGGLANHLATLRTTDGYERFLAWGKDVLLRTPVVGKHALRVAARREEGLQGRLRAAGHVRGPGPEVRRPDRRARHRGRRVRAAPRQALPRAGPRALPDREGPRLRARPARRGGPLPHRRRDGPADLRAARPVRRAAPGPRSSATRSSGSATSATDVVAITAAMLHPVGLGRVRRAVPRPGVGRRHRRAARGGLRGRARHRRAAPGRRRLRDLPQPRLRPAADGRGPAPVRGDLRPGPGRRHRRRRRLAQRHVGHVRSSRSCPGCGSPRRATPTSCAPSCGRRSTWTTRRP